MLFACKLRRHLHFRFMNSSSLPYDVLMQQETSQRGDTWDTLGIDVIIGSLHALKQGQLLPVLPLSQFPELGFLCSVLALHPLGR